MMMDVYRSPSFEAGKQRLSDFVIAELALMGNAVLNHWVTTTTQKFMRHGMDEETSLVAAYTFHASENSYAH